MSSQWPDVTLATGQTRTKPGIPCCSAADNRLAGRHTRPALPRTCRIGNTTTHMAAALIQQWPDPCKFELPTCGSVQHAPTPWMSHSSS
ncbi:hypothetical protein HaLaN_13674 [Haematococcus lacustris]|uniref:Uncharacterized protein n=1 Tax=Haematococcus lacustris TaxID=44745 RepID=A0A699ZE02_HAELA|nr:hypothetical protein HaLaN_13674 [Haematococcus lacustris]